MQQRQPRLGDILDDYCPRERRITNHAVVAMIDDEVKQTRCMTCEAEHEYKRARIPPTRKKKGSQVLQPPAPAGAESRGEGRDVAAAEAPSEGPLVPSGHESVVPAGGHPEASVDDGGAGLPAAPPPANASGATRADEGPVHRRLIRATLPRTEGQVVRQIPQFTIRQPPAGRPGVGGKGRGGRPHGATAGGGRGQGGKGGKGGRHAFNRGPEGFGGRARGREAAGGRPRHPQAGPGRPGKKPSK